MSTHEHEPAEIIESFVLGVEVNLKKPGKYTDEAVEFATKARDASLAQAEEYRQKSIEKPRCAEILELYIAKHESMAEQYQQIIDDLTTSKTVVKPMDLSATAHQKGGADDLKDQQA
jgi:hypothetical protein